MKHGVSFAASLQAATDGTSPSPFRPCNGTAMPFAAFNLVTSFSLRSFRLMRSSRAAFTALPKSLVADSF
eukprot:8135608-Alexandrium_andersonii.AAC.1